jgi:hypothetical protein
MCKKTKGDMGVDGEKEIFVYVKKPDFGHL